MRSTSYLKRDDTPTRFDPELVARRINGSVAADRQAIEIRERWRQDQTVNAEQDIFRRLEAIEAAICWLYNQVRTAEAT